MCHLFFFFFVIIIKITFFPGSSERTHTHTVFRWLRNWRLSVVRLWGKTQHIDIWQQMRSLFKKLRLLSNVRIRLAKRTASRSRAVMFDMRDPPWGIRIIVTVMLCLTDTYLGVNYNQNNATAHKRNVIATSNILPNDNVTPVSWYLCQPLSCRLKWALKCFVHVVSATIRSGGTLAKVATGKKRTSS